MWGRNVMVSDEGQPILMDFGSCRKARVKVENRSMALLEQVRFSILSTISNEIEQE